MSSGQGEAPPRDGATPRFSSTAEGVLVSVSSTRGQTDIRGLITAGRAFGGSDAACLETSVADEARGSRLEAP
jgi:hypothetical protein